MATSDLLLKLVITAKDEASTALGKVRDGIASAVQSALAFAGAALGLQKAVQAAGDFEEQLGKVAVKGGYSAAQMAMLTQGVERLATEFGVTGQEAAQGMEVLAAAGLNAEAALKTLPQVLALAKMEGLSLDEAATRLSDSLSTMGMGFDEAGRLADVLAKGANLSTASAASLSEALANVGGQAKASGLDLEQTVAALDLLHKNGIKGAAAGTSLAAILTQLLNPASAASTQLNLLGITSRDLGTVLDGLQAAGARSNQAILAFGETAGPGLRALIREGQTGLDTFTGELRNLDGDALKAAQSLSGNFNSAVKALGAAWDAVLRKLATPVLAPLTTALKAASGALQDTAGLMGGVFLAAAVAAGRGIAVFAAALPAWIAGLRTSIATLGAAQLAVAGFSRVLAVLTGPVGLIMTAVAGFLAFRQGAADSQGPLDALSGSVETQTEALRKLGAAQLQVAQNTLQKAIAEQTAEVARLGAAAQETAGKVGQQVIVWDDWRKGAHYVTVGQEQLAEANAKVETATQRLATLTQQYNAVTAEQASRAAAMTAAAVPQQQSLGALAAAYHQAQLGVQTYRENLALAAPGSEAARVMAIQLAEAEQGAARAKQAYLAALDPARAAQDKYNQTAAQAAQVLAPYKDLVDQLRTKLEIQQRAQQDTAVTADQLKQAQALLAEQTNVYWNTLKNVGGEEKGRPDLLAKTGEAYAQQEREVARLTLSQDGSAQSKQALDAATARLNQISLDYTATAKKEGEELDALAQKAEAAQAIIAAQTTGKLAVAEASLKLAQAAGDEAAASQAALAVAQLEEQQARETATAKQEQVTAAQQALTQKEREYALTLQNNPAQQAEIAQLRALVEQKKAEGQQAAVNIPLKERETQQATIMAGPIGQLARLYEANTKEHERAAAAVDSYYNAQVKEVEAAIRVAKARGDEAQAAELLEKKNRILIDQAYAMAQAKAQEVADAQNAVEVKRMELAADGELSAADREQIAVLENVVIAKQNAAAAAASNADAMEKEVAAAKEAATTAKKSKDNIDLANESFKQTGQELDYINAAYAKFRDQSAVAFGMEGIIEYNAIIKDIQSAIDEANTQAQRLADEGMAAATGNAGALAAELQNSQSYLNDAANAAADNLVSALKDAQEEAQDLREELAGVAADYTQKIMELAGDDYNSVLIDRAEALQDLTDKYKTAGMTATQEYTDAKKAVIAYYDVKLAKAKQDMLEDSTSKTIQKMNALADATDRATSSAYKLAQTNLSHLIGQTDTLGNSVKTLGSFF